jgi:hypothetical protein
MMLLKMEVRIGITERGLGRLSRALYGTSN